MHLTNTRKEIGHQPNARIGKVADRLAQIGRSGSNVGIADQDHVVLAVPIHRRETLDLRIQPEHRAADDELRVLKRKLTNKLRNHTNRRVGGSATPNSSWKQG